MYLDFASFYYSKVQSVLKIIISKAVIFYIFIQKATAEISKCFNNSTKRDTLFVLEIYRAIAFFPF